MKSEVILDTVDLQMVEFQEYLAENKIQAEEVSGMEVKYTGSRESLTEMVKVWWLDEYLLDLIVEVK